MNMYAGQHQRDTTKATKFIIDESHTQSETLSPTWKHYLFAPHTRGIFSHMQFRLRFYITAVMSHVRFQYTWRKTVDTKGTRKPLVPVVPIKQGCFLVLS